jgi:hypothetical protein
MQKFRIFSEEGAERHENILEFDGRGGRKD